ncbi:UNVERIFIED_CONTAM: hypothetical protein HDU68_011511, partial [Siphonaria sp. JEL0065]
MHSPKFFLSLLAVASAMIPAAQAGPLPRAKATLPGFYQPPSTSIDVVQSSFVGSSGPLSSKEAVAAATNYITSSLNIDAKDVKVSNAVYSADSKLHHIHITETHNGLPIANAVSNVNIDASGSVISAHQSFVPAAIKNKAGTKRDAPSVSLEQAVLQFAEAKGYKTNDKLSVTNKGGNEYTVTGASFAVSPIRASEKYYQTATGLVRVWDLNVEQADVWQNAFVSSENGDIVGVVNWTADASAEELNSVRIESRAVAPPQSVVKPSLGRRAILDAVYSVLPIGARNPQTNNGLTQVQNPWDTNASPNGWHSAKKDLSGNNVWAQSNPNNVGTISGLKALTRPQSNTQTFNYPFDATQGSSNANNKNAATTNMFYVTNAIHDVLYNYGFDEKAGNFQDDNFGKGGSGNDAVVATSQDGAGTNNANFATPPD